MEAWCLRPVLPADEAAVAAVIRSVMPAFGADGSGSGIHDPEVAPTAAAHARLGDAHFVLEHQGRAVGRAGMAPWRGGEARVCTFRKMHALPEARGQGWGERLVRIRLLHARGWGFRHCLLETLAGMTAAMALYRRVGFRPLAAPLGAAGHRGRDNWFIQDLGVNP